MSCGRATVSLTAEGKNQGGTDNWEEGKDIKVWEHAVPDRNFGQRDGWFLESEVVFSDVWLQGSL